MCLVQKFADREERGELKMAKDDGFLDAVFPDGRREKTEVSSALLAARQRAKEIQRRPAAAKRPAAKRPAAVSKKASAAKKNKKTEDDEEAEESEEQSEPDEEVEPAAEEGPAEARGYKVSWYKNGWQSALRRTHGAKNQICALGGKPYKKVLDEAKLRALAAELAEELVKGRVADTSEAAKRAGQALVHEAYLKHLKEKNASSHRSSSSSSPSPSPGPNSPSRGAPLPEGLPFVRGLPSCRVPPCQGHILLHVSVSDTSSPLGGDPSGRGFVGGGGRSERNAPT